MRLHEGMRRCLIAMLMALALAFAAAGCGPPHIKPSVPNKFDDIYNSEISNLYKHAPRPAPTPGDEYTPADEYG